MFHSFDDLLLANKGKKAITIALACPEDQDLVGIIRKTLDLGLAHYILIGDAAKTIELLHNDNLDHTLFEIYDIPNHKEAAEKAVSLVVEKKAEVVMKGELHTAVFLKAVLDKERGLRTGNLISEITLTEKMDGDGLQLITDCAMTISPTLDEKRQILENAVELALKLGFVKPRVAVLSAIEVVNPAIPDTLDAAILSKMAERGQIKNAIVDGPFALDNAISVDAAKHKNIGGEVAGRADIILVPNLQVGNVLRKALTFYAKKKTASAIMGTTSPIIMTSRTESVEGKMLSIAIAAYIADRP